MRRDRPRHERQVRDRPPAEAVRLLDPSAIVPTPSFIEQLLKEADPLGPATVTLLPLFLTGLSEKQIAFASGRSVHTVHAHARLLYQAFKVHSRPELLALALRQAVDAADSDDETGGP